MQLVFPCDWLCGEFSNEQPNGTKLVTQAQGIPRAGRAWTAARVDGALPQEGARVADRHLNGLAGVFEFDTFSKGTKAVLEAVAETTAAGNKGTIGGGDSDGGAKFDMEAWDLRLDRGGASLELLEGKPPASCSTERARSPRMARSSGAAVARKRVCFPLSAVASRLGDGSAPR